MLDESDPLKCLKRGDVNSYCIMGCMNSEHGGGGFFHSKGTWGCAAREGILFRTSSLAKGVLLATLVELSLGKGMLFGNFGQRDIKIRKFL